MGLPTHSAKVVSAQPKPFIGDPVQVRGRVTSTDGRSYVLDQSIAFELPKDSYWRPNIGETVVVKGYLKESSTSTASLYLKHASRGTD